MQLALKLIFSFLFLSVSVSCTSAGLKSKSKKSSLATPQKVFFGTYDNVWRAAQLSLKYPISANNMDSGVLETDFIKGDDGFRPPNEEDIPSSGIRYKLRMILVKGKVDGRDSVRVTIKKEIEKRRDFFADPEIIPSDGLEEMVIFYRMERELVIDEALKKAAKMSSN